MKKIIIIITSGLDLIGILTGQRFTFEDFR